jgi:hypothetical protein
MGAADRFRRSLNFFVPHPGKASATVRSGIGNFPISFFPAMAKIATIIAAILLILGGIEGVAYWWMNPPSATQGEPVLVYHPSRSVGVSPTTGGQAAERAEIQKSTLKNQESTISPSSPISTSPSFSLTPLPEIYAKSAPMLRCSSGQVLHASFADSSGLHLAFFEWDGTDAGSVLEAFRHMPEACMGSIGMKLVSRGKTIPYQIGSSTLLFDHTVFSEGAGVSMVSPPIHAFRAVWVSGVSAADARKGVGGRELDRLRTIRVQSALHRFRPAHARVIQGAVRGIPDPTLAWQAFEDTMLKDLQFVTRQE